MLFRIIVLCLGVSSFLASAEAPFQSLKSKVKMKTDVMVLGTTHLSAIKEPLTTSSLSSVIDKLRAFQPTAIAIESLRPKDVAGMLEQGDVYHDVVVQFVGSTLLQLANEQQQLLGLTAHQARLQLEGLLASNESSCDAYKTTIRHAIASYDGGTALLNWHYLHALEKCEGLDEKIDVYLQSEANENDERNQIAIALAKKSGLKRLHGIDDHRDKDLYPEVVAGLMDSYRKSKYVNAINETDYVKKPEQLKQQALTSGDWLPLYRWTNSEEYTSQVLNDEWNLFIDKDLAVEPSLARVALWEVRNQNISSHIMRLVSQNIGGKILVVIGSNHKVFLERYLEDMIGVNLVQFNEL